MNSVLFLSFLLCFPASLYSQDKEGISEPRPYCIEPAKYALNNRWYAECRAACTNRANHNISCSEYRISAQKHHPADSVLVAVYFFGANGFTDSAWFAEQKIARNYTKVGGRDVSTMECDCSDMHIAKGPPLGKTVEGKDKYMRCTRAFNANGYLEEQVDMKNGFIKYNDSWDGSWNVKTEYVIDTSENLRRKTIYLSHTRFFRHPQRETLYYFDAHNNFTGYTEYNYADGSLERHTLIYMAK